MAPNPAFLPPSQITSAGGDGNPYSGNGMVECQAPPRPRPFPWPYAFSAQQGQVGGAGGLGMVGVSIPPYNGPYQAYWPYQASRLNGLPTLALKT